VSTSSEEAPGPSEESFRLIVETIPGLIAVMTQEGEVEHVNRQVLDIVLRDGTIKHLHTIGHPVLNEAGDLVEYVGTGMDVTEQRQAQAALENAFEEIKRLKNRLQDEKLALAICNRYPWPGNIRELQNIVERSVIPCSGDTFSIDDAWLSSEAPLRAHGSGPLPETLQDQEWEMIEAALAKSRGKVAGPRGAAAKLGIPASTLESKIEQLGIEKRRFTTAS